MMIKLEKIELIDGSPCISNVEITATAANFYYDQAEDKDYDLGEFYTALFDVIKRHIVQLEKTLPNHIHRINGECFLDRAAFYELSQVYRNGEQRGLDEAYTQTILAELGEYRQPKVAA